MVLTQQKQQQQSQKVREIWKDQTKAKKSSNGIDCAIVCSKPEKTAWILFFTFSHCLTRT